MRTKRRPPASRRHPTRRWTLLQKGLAYALLVVCFISALTYVSQGIEVKNIAYAMQHLIRQKRALLEQKQILQLSLLEQQSFDRVEDLLERFDLPLEPGPRLEIVLEEPIDDLTLAQAPSAADPENRWRDWLARMNQAQAMMSSGNHRAFGWRSSIVGRAGRIRTRSETE